MNESAPLAYEETKELIRLAQQGDEAAQERLTAPRRRVLQLAGLEVCRVAARLLRVWLGF